MKRESIVCAICAGCFGILGCDQDSQNGAMDVLLQSLDLDPSIELKIDCLPSPPGTRSVLFAGIFVNQRSPGPACPSTTKCSANTVERQGETS